jgi:predicted nucleic acid-binding protein
MIVVADTTPLNYLILIEQIQLLPQLYGQVLAPPAVFAELSDPRSPELVRHWIAQTPDWLQICSPQSILSDFPDVLGSGEREAIALPRSFMLMPCSWMNGTDGSKQSDGI